MVEGHSLDSLGPKPHASDYSSQAFIHEDDVGFLRDYIELLKQIVKRRYLETSNRKWP